MKRYLTGIDWVINSIDYIGKAQTGIGNVSQVAIELKGQPDSKALQETLTSFIRKFPILNGLPSRALNLCPYWKIFPQKKMLPLRINTVCLDANADFHSSLAAQINEPFKNKREHLVFNFIHSDKRNFLGLIFDHRILDARGAEAFLDLFQRYYQKEHFPDLVFEEPHHLNHWADRFRAGRQVNRFFLNLSKNIPRILPLSSNSRTCKIKIIPFDAEEANHIVKVAYEQAGYLMLMPFLLAKTLQTLHRVFEAKKSQGAVYLIPVTIDARQEEGASEKIFFNHLSFFFFKINAEEVDNLTNLIASIKKQMYEQVKIQLPTALKSASLLLRIAPLPLVNFSLRLMSKKNFASFPFSFVSSAFSSSEFMEEEVRNIFHLPRVPNPPGVGIFFNQFKGRLNATISYFEGIFNNDEIEQIAKDLKGIGNEG
ncbi:MAG: hypothetical protein HQ547_03505 [Candidatus Omnitrophica bacterium]|nr:hypothetical protein [Candidatus Omnitrophota bacterium]